MKPKRVLFVTWDGPQTNYLESLYAPIFDRLMGLGFGFDILQFRWGDERAWQEIEAGFGAQGIRYRAVPVMRMPPAIGPFVSALLGARHIRKSVKDFASEAIMPRSLMPALSVLAAGGSKLRPIIFDADGLQADERIDFQGSHRFGAVYRVLRLVEARTVREAKSVMVRSEFAASILAKRARVSPNRFHVVTNGRDQELFEPGTFTSRRSVRRKLGIEADAPLLIYVGSVGPQYRFDMIAKTAAAVRERNRDAHLLILTGSPAEARSAIVQSNANVLPMTSIRTAAGADVPHMIAAADMGLSFRTAAFSTKAVSPIKTAEYLLCGVPVFGTAGVGDTTEAERAGVFMDEAATPNGAAIWLCGEILANRKDYRHRARTVGVERFSLTRSVEDYLSALKVLEERVIAGE